MSLRTSSREISVIKITRIIYTWLFTLLSYLTTKESYNWWVTRRKWGFRHQISEAKYLKVSVANIWKHSGGFRRCTKWLQNFTDVQDGCEMISQPKADFAACEIGLQLDVIDFQWL